MAKKSKNPNGKGKSRSAVTGRYVPKVSREAQEFSRHFDKQYRETLKDLSKR